MTLSRLEHDTLIIKGVFEEYFDRDFEHQIDASGTTAVLFVPKNAPSEDMPIRELAEYVQGYPDSLSELTKDRAQKCADPLPVRKAHGQKLMNRSGATKVDEWLLRKGGMPAEKAAATVKETRDAKKNGTPAVSDCSHEPKYLEGLCLECFNKSLPKDIAAIHRRTQAAWAKATSGKTELTRAAVAEADSEIEIDKVVVYYATFSLQITLVTKYGTLYRILKYRPESAKLVRDNLLFVSKSMAEYLDGAFDRAFDTVITIEDGMTVVTTRTGDREQDWMTIGDVAARLSQLLSRPISRETVEELTKTRTQKRDQKKGNALPFLKGHAKMKRFYRPLFELWFDEWDNWNKENVRRPRELGIPRKGRH